MTTSIAPAPPETGDEVVGRWVVPEPVAVPDTTKWLETGRRINGIIGMRAPGWLLLAGVLFAMVLGITLRWQELRLFAICGGIIWLIALGFTIGRPTFEVGLDVDDTRVVVGEPANGGLAVRNVGNRRNLPARLDLPIGEEIASFHMPSMAPGGERHEQFAIPTRRRGVVPVGPALSVQGDPFGLSGRETTWGEQIEVFVHPRTVPLAGRMTGFVHDLEGHSSNRTSASDMSFQALREYAPGDDRRHVHWKSSAHIGKLMVRQFEETLQSRVALGIDLATTSYIGEEDFELAVSVAGSVALAALREQNPFTMFDNRKALPAVSGPRALDELSRVEMAPRTNLLELANTVLQLDPRASVVFLVTGGGITMEGLRRVCAIFDLDTRVVGVAADPDTAMSVRNVANLSLVRVPGLDVLGRCLRRAMA
ncbi:hypothetical protein HMPREF1531_00426 [Propionibacterium sp. oral taxon 192 str. F0372]|uniref:DUF58 domain-containing protein n=1 Tax=Propionibacterium sp. oral taxon 192 TaxID=671222 RepID=UPI00035431BC|nr:DUF58 domain-containing protein [Propionibacterium sp. oral taxon 192]EPH06824.1 hypothetical protein HMPREF1531_00426 [Propionibacterium sp. oral taxon 192 str. F0372]